MSQQEVISKLSVTVIYADKRVEFSGSPEQVLVSVNSFLQKQVPSLDLAEKISINYSISELIKLFGDYVKITPEGPRVWSGERRLSDREIVALQLVSAKIGCAANKFPRESLGLGEIQSATGIKPKSVSSRLSEISKMGYVEKDSTEEGVRYRITTQGVHWLSNELTRRTARNRGTRAVSATRLSQDRFCGPL